MTDETAIEDLQGETTTPEDLLAGDSSEKRISEQQRQDDQRRAEELAGAYGLECVDMTHF